MEQLGIKQELISQIELIRAYLKSDSISQIEIDIIKEKLRFIYENISEVKIDDSQSEAVSKAVLEISEPVVESKPEPEVVEDIIIQFTELDEEEIQEVEPAINVVEPQPEVIPEPEVVQEKVIEPEPEILQQVHTPQPKISVTDNDLAQKLGKKPISNIATAIGINERFQLINELFNKNADLYMSTIQELNSLHNFIEALDLLQTRFEWDYENQLVQRFVSIVERRYL